MTKFKVGDVVRCVGRGIRGVGTILNVDDPYAKVKFSNCLIWMWDYRLELVSSDNKICWQREGF